MLHHLVLWLFRSTDWCVTRVIRAKTLVQLSTSSRTTNKLFQKKVENQEYFYINFIWPGCHSTCLVNANKYFRRILWYTKTFNFFSPFIWFYSRKIKYYYVLWLLGKHPKINLKIGKIQFCFYFRQGKEKRLDPDPFRF